MGAARGVRYTITSSVRRHEVASMGTSCYSLRDFKLHFLLLINEFVPCIRHSEKSHLDHQPSFKQVYCG